MVKINKEVSSYKTPYKIVLLDAMDTYYYADVMDNMEVFDTLDSLEVAKALADSLFVIKNYKWKSLQEMNNVDGGWDVRIYDENSTCIYAAHQRFTKSWIGSEKI